MEHLTHKQLVDKLAERTQFMSLAHAASAIGVSRQWLDDVLKSKRFPGPTICEYLGYVEVKAAPMYAPRKYKKASK